MRAAEHYTPRPADGASDRQELERRRQAPDVAKEARREQANKVARLEGEVERLAEAIASGAGSSKTLVAKLIDRETELKEAKATLEHLDGLSVEFEGKGSDLAGWLAEVQEIVAGLEKTIDPANPQKSRQTLKHLLTTPIVVTPGDDATWLYAFTAAWAGMPAELIDACYPPSRGRAAVRCKEQRVLLHRQPPCLNGVPPG